MRKIFATIAIVLLSGLLTFAQAPTTAIHLKSGLVLTGELVKLDPTSELVIKISGIETTIKMTDVERIESVTPTPVNEDKPQPSQGTALPGLPKSVSISVGDCAIEMVLIPGTTFSMGFDGDNSRWCKSDPVHPVRLSDFYVSKESLTNELVAALGEPTYNDKKYYKADTWKTAAALVGILSDKTGQPFRLITEAEFEFLSTGSRRNELILDSEGNETDYCLDFFARFPDSKELVENPTGPVSGKYHVVRGFYNGKGTNDFAENLSEYWPYRRANDEFTKARDKRDWRDRLPPVPDEYCIRVVIPASKLDFSLIP
ncbi:MAG: hypothetical protein J5764_00460 [Bacteroidales bacterium]|nr:hypothetical protein [Bacteroidales bacterium]